MSYDVWERIWRPELISKRAAVRRKLLTVCWKLVIERPLTSGYHPDNRIAIQ